MDKLPHEKLHEWVEESEKGDYFAFTLMKAELAPDRSGDWAERESFLRLAKTQEVRQDICSACGYGFGVSRRDHYPFEMEKLTDIPNYCPHCGARVERDD